MKNSRIFANETDFGRQTRLGSYRNKTPRDFLCKNGWYIEVKIDRPLGSKHPKWGFEYPINYGYIPNTKSGDGEEIDVYVLGADEPIDEFEGKVIGMIHRIDEDDDKLIVTDGRHYYTEEEIRQMTNFQEKFFKSEILLNYELVDDDYDWFTGHTRSSECCPFCKSKNISYYRYGLILENEAYLRDAKSGKLRKDGQIVKTTKTGEPLLTPLHRCNDCDKDFDYGVHE
jgi:inorganic pyrophosphatase